MKYLKTRYFNTWAKKEGLLDIDLRGAIAEFEAGLYEARLGKHLFKKRIRIQGRGKRSGARTILFYQEESKLVFCYGFAKNEKENLSHKEKKALLYISSMLRESFDKEIQANIEAGKLIEIQAVKNSHF